MKKVGFIGVGNMGGALLEAILKKVSGSDVIVSDLNAEKTSYFHEKYGCEVGSAFDAAEKSEFLYFCVKPQAAEQTFNEIKSALISRSEKPVLVSIMAGVTIARILSLAGELPVIRIMPNVAASVGEGMILCDSIGVSDGELCEFKDMMLEAGKLDMLPEKLIDAGSAVSGCGPAYVCLFIEAMADGAVKCGIPRKKALEYAIQTVLGTAALLESTGKHPAVVKDEVTSPAGTTIEGVQALEESGFRGAVMKAIVAAYEKNMKL